MTKFRKIVENILKEAKQVGDLYHATDVKGLAGILNSDEIHVNEYSSGNSEGISTSRDKTLFYRAPAALILDGDKLSEKYKLEPYTTFNFQDFYARDESETVIKVKPNPDENALWTYVLPDIHKYIKGILIQPNAFYSKDIVKALYDILKKYDYPIYTIRGQRLNINDFWKYHKEIFKKNTLPYDIQHETFALGYSPKDLGYFKKLKLNKQQAKINKLVQKEFNKDLKTAWQDDIEKYNTIYKKYKTQTTTNSKANPFFKFTTANDMLKKK